MPRPRPGVLAGALLLPLLLLAAPQLGWAQFYRFGKNKVQFTEFAWQRLETPHFDVYFFPQEEALAGTAASMAEAAYSRLQQRLAHTVQRRIPLIIYSSHIYFEQTNVIPNLLPEGVGGFTEFLKGRVALPLSGSIPEFGRVLRHELVHVFTFDLIRQVLKRNDITEYRLPPLWLSEGIAEYWAGGWDSRADMVLRDALFAERLVPIAQMYRINGSYLMYKEGQSICAYMAATYGEDIFERLFRGWWRGRDFAQVFKAITGDSVERLDRNWRYQARKRYLADITRGDLPSQVSRQLTQEGFNVKPALLGAVDDSASFVFFRNQRGYTCIARSTLGAAAPQVIAPGERSPGIESLHPLDSKPAVSRDGRLLAYAAKHRGCDHLYVRDLQAHCRLHDLAFPHLVAISSPTWSPDGTRLVFSGADPGGMTDLYMVQLATREVQQLTHDPYHDQDPDWSPDGHHIVFSSDRWPGGEGGDHKLFALHLPSRRLSRLTTGEGDDIQPAWAPEGTCIAFSSNRGGIYNVHAIRVGGDTLGELLPSKPLRLTRVLTGAFAPVWLPRRAGVLFCAYEAGEFQIFHQSVVAAGVDTLRLRNPGPTVADSTWMPPGWGHEQLYVPQGYDRRLSLDVVQSQISQDPQLGTSGGIQLALSDVLGNDQYFFVLSHIAGSETGFFDGLNVTLARLHQGRRLHVLWGVFRLNDRLSSRYGRYVRERRTGGYLELGYPFSRYDRVETQFSLRRARIDRDFEGRPLSGWLVTNRISYIHDSSLWLPTGPLEGKRYSIGVGQTIDFRRSRRFNTTLFADYRHYFRLSRRSALAVRCMGRRSQGAVPETFALGGSWTLRGYPWMSIWGSKMVLLNQELRFPLVDRLVVRFPFGNVDFSALRGALFVDAGNAWTHHFAGWRGSMGVGMRLALGGVFVFRLDGTRRTDFHTVANDTHWDFFFGWDF